MRAHRIVGGNHLGRLAVDFVPLATHIGTQPALEWSKVLSKRLPIVVRSTNSFFLWQEFVRQISASILLAAATAVTRFFNDDLVHV